MAKEKNFTHFIVPDGVARVFIGNQEIHIHEGKIRANPDQVDEFTAAGYVPIKHVEKEKE
jgi:hypothetical protein